MTKDTIQEVAINIIADYGYDTLTLSKIAEECKIKKASLYYYFDSKEALISSLYEQFSKEIRKLGISISFEQGVETIINKTFLHWKKIYTKDNYLPYLSLIFQRREIDERAAEISNSLTLMIQAQSQAVIENLLARHECIIKDKELLTELFSSTSIFYLENDRDENLFLPKFIALFLH